MLSVIAETRLRKLTKHVREHVVDGKFGMLRFADSCGTPSCMGGWATVFLPETGLSLLTLDASDFDEEPETNHTLVGPVKPSGNSIQSLELNALIDAFDLSVSQVSELFYDFFEMGREETCDRFDRFIDCGGVLNREDWYQEQLEI